MGTSKYAFEGRNGSELMEAIKRNQARKLLYLVLFIFKGQIDKKKIKNFVGIF